MGVTLGGYTANSCNNNHLLLIICTRLSHKKFPDLLGELDLILEKETARNNIRKVFASTL